MELLHTAHIPAGPGPFPTLVLLHGWGASAHDLFGLAPLLHGGQALVLCPQGPIRLELGPGAYGYGWFPITGGAPPDPAAYAQGTAAVRNFLTTALERYPVDREHLVLLGFSQGGVMAYDLFLREPERFAGLIALSTWLPEALVATAPPKDAHADRPVLVMHGESDPMIAVDRARDSRDRLLPYRLDLRYREFPMAHEINPTALRELVEWLEDRPLNPVLR